MGLGDEEQVCVLAPQPINLRWVGDRGTNPGGTDLICPINLSLPRFIPTGQSQASPHPLGLITITPSAQLSLSSLPPSIDDDELSCTSVSLGHSNLANNPSLATPAFLFPFPSFRSNRIGPRALKVPPNSEGEKDLTPPGSFRVPSMANWKWIMDLGGESLHSPKTEERGGEGGGLRFAGRIDGPRGLVGPKPRFGTFKNGQETDEVMDGDPHLHPFVVFGVPQQPINHPPIMSFLSILAFCPSIFHPIISSSSECPFSCQSQPSECAQNGLS